MWLATLLAISSTAQGAAGDGWQDPTAMVGVGVARWGPRVGGHSMVGDQVGAELGVGVRDLDIEQLVFDWAVYWRPDFACFGCGGRVLGTLGLGVGGPLSPSFTGDPWAIGVGPDFTASGVAWLGRSVGVHLTGRVGLGPTLMTDADLTIDVVEPWFMGSVGLAF